MLFEAGKGKGRARGRLRSDTDDRSDSLPTPGRFDDVTELSEFLRGRVGGFVDFRRMDLTGCPSRPMGCGCCCGCCCWDTRGCNCICCSRSRTCSCLSLSGHSALDDFRLPYRSSRSARAVPVPPILGRRYCRSLSMSFMSVCISGGGCGVRLILQLGFRSGKQVILELFRSVLVLGGVMESLCCH